MPWHTLTCIDIEAVKTSEFRRVSERTGKPLSSASVNKLVWALKGVARACWKMSLIDAETYYRIKDIKGVRKDRSGHEADRPGRYVTQGERERVIKACDDDTDAGYRDEAILFLLCSCGLRRGEIPRLSMGSILADDNEMMTFEVEGKGRKWRTIYLNNRGHDALLNWLDIRGREPGPLFWRGRRGGHLERGQPIGQHSIYGLLRKRAGQAGVMNIATHDLRRSCISDLLGAGVDIATVAAMMGHASVTTTAAYDRRGTEARITAAKILHFAGRPRRQQDRLV